MSRNSNRSRLVARAMSLAPFVDMLPRGVAHDTPIEISNNRCVNPRQREVPFDEDGFCRRVVRLARRVFGPNARVYGV